MYCMYVCRMNIQYVYYVCMSVSIPTMPSHARMMLAIRSCSVGFAATGVHIGVHFIRPELLLQIFPPLWRKIRQYVCMT